MRFQADDRVPRGNSVLEIELGPHGELLRVSDVVLVNAADLQGITGKELSQRRAAIGAQLIRIGERALSA